MKSLPAQSENHWPHRFAVMLAVVVFPLIWVGGLVTTYDAGMAVPDWPGTYGYNLFLYPISTWLAGPFDLFIEHGHRLLGSLAGLMTILLAVAAWRGDARPWFRYLTIVALALVIFQGGLGGARVLLDSRTVAMVHGCVGPVFFALAAAMIVVSSSGWRARHTEDWEHSGSVRRLGLLVAGMAYLQLVLGAQVRHMPASASFDAFRVAILFHLLMAVVLVLHIGLLAWRAGRSPARPVARLAYWLVLLAIAQVSLGCAVWVLKYGWPAGLGEHFQMTAGLQLVAQSYWQSLLTTAHVAVGSLILAVAVALNLRSFRHLRAGAVAAGSVPMILGVSG